MKNRTSKTYNKVVNIDENGEITVLSEIFNYKDGFKGATGSVFRPITEDDIQNAISEYEGNDLELLAYMADNFGELTGDMVRNVDSSREALIEMFFDRSYNELWNDIKKQCGLGDEVIMFDCVGGGRCFDKDFKGNRNPKLCKLIREAETE